MLLSEEKLDESYEKSLSNQVHMIKLDWESEQLRSSEKVSLLFFGVYSFMCLFENVALTNTYMAELLSLEKKLIN